MSTTHQQVPNLDTEPAAPGGFDPGPHATRVIRERHGDKLWTFVLDADDTVLDLWSVSDQLGSHPATQCEVCCFRPSDVDVNGWLLCRGCAQELADA